MKVEVLPFWLVAPAITDAAPWTRVGRPGTHDHTIPEATA